MKSYIYLEILLFRCFSHECCLMAGVGILGYVGYAPSIVAVHKRLYQYYERAGKKRRRRISWQRADLASNKCTGGIFSQVFFSNSGKAHEVERKR